MPKHTMSSNSELRLRRPTDRYPHLRITLKPAAILMLNTARSPHQIRWLCGSNDSDGTHDDIHSNRASRSVNRIRPVYRRQRVLSGNGAPACALVGTVKRPTKTVDLPERPRYN